MKNIIQSYLWHGYLPPNSLPSWLIDDVKQAPSTCEWSVAEAIKQVHTLFDRILQKTSGPHIVPISGGWDSRLILAELLGRLDTSEIIAYTFGRPGQLDYELGRQIAIEAGVEHYSIDLSKTTVCWEALAATVKTSAWTFVPDGYFFETARSELSINDRYSFWVGFLGEALTGGHYQDIKIKDSMELAQKRFMRIEKRYPYNEDALSSPPYYKGFYGLQDGPLLQRDYLDLGVRELSCIARIVLPTGEWKGWTPFQGRTDQGVSVVAPFCDINWARYWLHMPRHFHKKQWLYRNMAQSKHPRMFGLPSKYSWGYDRERVLIQQIWRVQHGVRNRLHKVLPILPIRSGLMDNYVDYQAAFRKDDGWIAIVERSLDVLKERVATPWLDIDQIWREHYRGIRDHSKALLLLIGLAVNLEVNTANGDVLRSL